MILATHIEHWYDRGKCPCYEMGKYDSHIDNICYDISVPFHTHFNDFIYLFFERGPPPGPLKIFQKNNFFG